MKKNKYFWRRFWQIFSAIGILYYTFLKDIILPKDVLMMMFWVMIFLMEEIRNTRELAKPIEEKKEYILCAAIWYKEIPLKKVLDGVLPKNCNSGLVVLGHRHGQCMWTMGSLTGLRSVENGEDSVGKYIQGFLTNTNRFVDREEAAKIAFEAKQIEEPKQTLYSEDLY